MEELLVEALLLCNDRHTQLIHLFKHNFMLFR